MGLCLLFYLQLIWRLSIYNIYVVPDGGPSFARKFHNKCIQFFIKTIIKLLLINNLNVSGENNIFIVFFKMISRLTMVFKRNDLSQLGNAISSRDRKFEILRDQKFRSREIPAFSRSRVLFEKTLLFLFGKLKLDEN